MKSSFARSVAAGPPAPASVEYDSAASANPALAELYELARARDLLRLMVVHGLKARYKRSMFGVLWTLLGPLMTAAVLTLAFSGVFRSVTPNYALYVFVGLVFWNYFSQTTTASLSAFAWGGGLLKKVYIPRTAYAVAACAAGFVNLMIALVPVAGVALVTGHGLQWPALFLPVSALVVAAFALGVSLLMSTLVALFADVAHVYQIGLQFMFYLTPVMYPASALPRGYAAYLAANPLYVLLELFRAPVYDGALPGAGTIAAAVAWALSSLAFGWWIFTRRADELVYRL